MAYSSPMLKTDLEPQLDVSDMLTLNEHLERHEIARSFERLRPHGSRVALFAMMRRSVRNEAEAELCSQGSQIALDEIARVLAIIDGPLEDAGHPSGAVIWLRQHIAAVPNAHEGCRAFAQAMRDMAASASTNSENLIDRVFEGARVAATVFSPPNTQVIANLYEELDRHLARRNDAIGGIVTEATKTLNRIAKISLHVRMISLNASVEAARAGQAGSGFGVVAREIKDLAEDIKDAGQTAQTSMNELMWFAKG